MDKDFVLNAIKLLLGNAWNRAALLLIFGGVAALNGWLQYAIGGLLKIQMPDTPAWVGFSLIGLGIVLLFANRLLPEAQRTPLSEDDRRLAEQVRQLLMDPMFLKALRGSQQEPDVLEDFLVRASNVRFDNPELQAEFEALVGRARSLREAIEKVRTMSFIAIIPLPYDLIFTHLASFWMRINVKRFFQNIR